MKQDMMWVAVHQQDYTQNHLRLTPADNHASTSSLDFLQAGCYS